MTASDPRVCVKTIFVNGFEDETAALTASRYYQRELPSISIQPVSQITLLMMPD